MKKSLLAIIVSVLLISGNKSNAQSYLIFTMAGNGVAGFSGDGASAVAAELNYPSGMASDNLSDTIYICDYDNNRIRWYNFSNGYIYTYAGTGNAGFSGDGGPASAAELNGPYGIAADMHGNLFIADQLNYRVRVVNSSGNISTMAGNGMSGYSGDGGQATLAEISTPYAVAVDNHGNVFISDNANNVVRKVNSIGIISTYAGTGVYGFSGDGAAASSAQLFYPNGLAADTSGNLYIVDEDNYRIREVNSSGIINTIAGNGVPGYSGDGGPPTNAELNYPTGICLLPIGNVIEIADFGNSRVRQILLGQITTIAGNGMPGYSGDGGYATSAELNFPYAVFSAQDYIYVADYHNQRIRGLTLPTGMKENSNPQISITVYPNPSAGIFSIQLSVVGGQSQRDPFGWSVEVYNLLGEKVFSQSNIHIPTFNIDLQSESNGVYFYRVISTDDGLLGEGKVLISH